MKQRGWRWKRRRSIKLVLFLFFNHTLLHSVRNNTQKILRGGEAFHADHAQGEFVVRSRNRGPRGSCGEPSSATPRMKTIDHARLNREYIYI